MTKDQRQAYRGEAEIILEVSTDDLLLSQAARVLELLDREEQLRKTAGGQNGKIRELQGKLERARANNNQAA